MWRLSAWRKTSWELKTGNKLEQTFSTKSSRALLVEPGLDLPGRRKHNPADSLFPLSPVKTFQEGSPWGEAS